MDGRGGGITSGSNTASSFAGADVRVRDMGPDYVDFVLSNVDLR